MWRSIPTLFHYMWHLSIHLTLLTISYADTTSPIALQTRFPAFFATINFHRGNKKWRNYSLYVGKLPSYGRWDGEVWRDGGCDGQEVHNTFGKSSFNQHWFQSLGQIYMKLYILRNINEWRIKCIWMYIVNGKINRNDPVQYVRLNPMTLNFLQASSEELTLMSLTQGWNFTLSVLIK